MANSGNEPGTRLIKFSAAIIRGTMNLELGGAEKHISNQLLRSGTSAGANYEEARAAESRKDFIHKMQVSLKEMRESYYWLAVTIEASPVKSPELTNLLEESRQLRAILSKAVATAKANNKS